MYTPFTPYFYIVKVRFTGVFIIFFYFCSKTYIAGEAVLTCIHNICFEQKYEHSKTISTENCPFYSSEKTLYIAWACFRNEMLSSVVSA